MPLPLIFTSVGQIDPVGASLTPKTAVDNRSNCLYIRYQKYRMGDGAVDRMTSLAVFTAAVEGGSVAAAARRHKMTPAMAGRHIDSLEQALKARLLQRTTRRLHLTDVGRAYYQRSRRILEEFEEAQRQA